MRKVLCIVAALLVGAAFMWPPTFAHEPKYNEEDVELLARLIAAEARGESYDGQLAVGAVVMNRVDTGVWGDTLETVIYYSGQFAEPHKHYTENCYDAAREVLLEEKRVMPNYVLYFQREKADTFQGVPWHCTIGRHNFYGAPPDYG